MYWLTFSVRLRIQNRITFESLSLSNSAQWHTANESEIKQKKRFDCREVGLPRQRPDWSCESELARCKQTKKFENRSRKQKLKTEGDVTFLFQEHWHQWSAHRVEWLVRAGRLLVEFAARLFDWRRSNALISQLEKQRKKLFKSLRFPSQLIDFKCPIRFLS